MNVTRKQLAERAASHIGESAPNDTCVSLGMNKWPQELDLPGIGTNSVSEAKVRAQRGYNGWSYHQDLDDLQIGDFVDWDPSVLNDPDDRHVSIAAEFDAHGAVKSIGAGGPTGKVAYQPRGGGFNPRSMFRGFFRVPLPAKQSSSRPTSDTTAIQTASAGKPTAKNTYTVKRGDNLLHVAAAHHTTVGRLVKLNRIRNADHIEVGQQLQLA